jgi:hypothetical protein
LICQYGSGVVLPMVDSVEADCWEGFGLFAMFSFTSPEPFNRESTRRFE